MTEHVLHLAGAQCVAGDLILNNVVVGQYRNGQFLITPEGAKVAAEFEATDAPVAKPTRKKRLTTDSSESAPEGAQTDEAGA